MTNTIKFLFYKHLSLILVGLLWLLTFSFVYLNSNSIISTHFDFFGNVDGFMNKRALFIFPCFATFILISFYILKKNPQYFNSTINLKTQTKERVIKEIMNTELKIISISLFIFSFICYTSIIKISHISTLGIMIVLGLIFKFLKKKPLIND